MKQCTSVCRTGFEDRFLGPFFRNAPCPILPEENEEFDLDEPDAPETNTPSIIPAEMMNNLVEDDGDDDFGDDLPINDSGHDILIEDHGDKLGEDDINFDNLLEY